MGLFNGKAKKLYKEALPLYEQGRYKEAEENMKAAAELGHKEAMYLCGNMELKWSYDRAAEWYAKAAARRHDKAREALNDLCIYPSVRRKYNLGLELIARAEKGDVKAQVALAENLYEDARKKGPEACDKPLHWAREAARQGSREGQYLCGKIYLEGKKDPDSALEWYSLAAEQGDHWSCYGCGRIMKEKKDDEAAAAWFMKAWELGEDRNSPAECIRAYARIGTDEACEKVYALVKKYVAEREEYYRRAGYTMPHDEYKMTKELRNLCGDLYYRQGRKKEAYEQYRDIGYFDEHAMTRCAQMQYEGDGIPQNRAEAYRLYKILADEKHSANAIYQCGKMCLFGDGVPEDAERAFRWFSTRRDDRCCYLTIAMYQQGIGVEKDEIKAKELLQGFSLDSFRREQEEWLKECAAHGYPWGELIVYSKTIELESELRRKQAEVKQLDAELRRLEAEKKRRGKNT